MEPFKATADKLMENKLEKLIRTQTVSCEGKEHWHWGLSLISTVNFLQYLQLKEYLYKSYDNYFQFNPTLKKCVKPCSVRNQSKIALSKI